MRSLDGTAGSIRLAAVAVLLLGVAGSTTAARLLAGGAPGPGKSELLGPPDAELLLKGELKRVSTSGLSAVNVVSTTLVKRLTGPDSPNRTVERWNVYGTDLGHSFVHGDRLYLVFGDTFGPNEGDWRSNVMAYVDGTTQNSLPFAGMITDERGWAAELIPSRKVDGIEMTVIPTYGISLDGRMVLHFMSIRTWTKPGRWVTNYAGLAWSDDDGRTWQQVRGWRWPGTSNFVQVAFVEEGRFVYLFGIPTGRFGRVGLARVPRADILRLEAYRYWDGHRWSTNARDTVPIIQQPVGELSVRWSEYHQRWLMMYLNAGRSAILLRTAEELTGPWSEERIVTTGVDHPQLYAPFILPWEIDGPEVHFTMSLYDPYDVYLMRTTLERQG
ncbi:MAG: DUF4185 domain-containing protein [Nitriliruptorales bacterium]